MPKVYMNWGKCPNCGKKELHLIERYKVKDACWWCSVCLTVFAPTNDKVKWAKAVGQYYEGGGEDVPESV